MSTHDLLAETLPLLPPPPQQQQQPRSSLTNNRLITISTINNIEIPSILIDNIIHIRLVDLSKHLLNNLQLSLIKHYAKQCNCLIIQCQEFLRDFLIRNNRQASTSRSCFCLTFDDCKKIYQELTQYLPSLLNPMKQQQNEMIVHNKRKHSQTSWVLEAVKPLKKRLKQQQDIVFHLIHDHDYLAEHNMHHLMINNNMKRKASKTISKSILSGIEQLPLIKKITTLPSE
ncbi:unnamed protein product [Didymodactylos carnosus]|uniref:Putative Dachshund-homology domain-containing protein n=1 Tax=Didymodactylos carnosus TaxID=1234261 RepID=A0A8S2F7R4_9BILA|nr:unnamed protein product [Didymodactylos carnosus]CAF4165735.1 unnamed protein product [Didymodactylos carnosus]